MIFPFADLPNPSGFRPWVTWALIAVNVLVYLLVTLPLSVNPVQPGDPLLAAYLDAVGHRLPAGAEDELLAALSQYDLFTFAHGYKPGAPEAGDLFASLFLHGGLAHLFGNMLFLWIFGDNVEHRLGRALALLVYLSSGVAATLGHAALDPGSMVPLVGASGAISGVLGTYFVLFRHNRVRMLVLLFPWIMRVVEVPSRIVLGAYIVIDNLLPLWLGSSSSVAYGAHIGGFVMGVLWALAGEAVDWRWPRARRGGGDLASAVRRGDPEDALRAFTPQGARELAPGERVALAEWLAGTGAVAEATAVLKGAWRDSHDVRERARILLALAKVRLHEGQVAAAWQALAEVRGMAPGTPEAAEAQVLMEGLRARVR